MWRIGSAFLCGHCCIHLLPSLPPPWPGVVLPAVVLLIAAALRSLLLAIAVCGMGWAWAHAYAHINEDLPQALEGRDLLVVGHIASIVDTRDTDPQFEFAVKSSAVGVPPKLKLTWYDATLQPRPGELWQFVVRLKRRNGFANPGGFDYEAHLFRARIGATGYIRADERNRRIAAGNWRHGVLRVRAWLAERIALAAGNSRMLGVLQGLAVGETRAMSPQQWRVFAATGTTHLLAISGLHISMIAALAAALGGLIVRWPGAQRLRITAIHGQTIAGMSAAVGYSLLAGMSVPTQRTLVMLCIYFAARWSRRAMSVGNALGLSLLGVLLVDPFAPLSVGAWLSFGAVAVIIVATSGRLRAAGALVNFARVQWSVTVGLLPILVIAFGGVSLISPVANAIAVPLFTLVLVPLVLTGTAVAALSSEIGGWLLTFASQLLSWCWPLMQWLSEQPVAMGYLPRSPILVYALLAVGAMLLVLPGVAPLRVAALALCVPAMSFRPPTPAQGAFELTMLDVGQGLAVVVATHSHTLVYDTGPGFRTGRDTGELVVLPFLRSRGVRAIDRLIVSHGDFDHDGGMDSLLAGMTTRSVLAGPSVRQNAANLERCTQGQSWIWDGVTFEIVHPGPLSSAGKDNDSSCVLRVSAAGGSALLTGDIEALAEEEIVARELRPVDVVTIPHHGSRSSSTAAFIAAVQPTLALVSAGYGNRWQFPKRDVVERWRMAGADIASTIDSGAIAVTLEPHRPISVRHFRREHRRYWSAR